MSDTATQEPSTEISSGEQQPPVLTLDGTAYAYNDLSDS